MRTGLKALEKYIAGMTNRELEEFRELEERLLGDNNIKSSFAIAEVDG